VTELESCPQDGTLGASHPGPAGEPRVELAFPPGHFCLAHTRNGSHEGHTFRTCRNKTMEIPEDGKVTSCCLRFTSSLAFQDFTFVFYPVALAISSLFLLATLLVYIINPDLHRPLFGKITLGFVVNNLIAYICIISIYLPESLIPLHSAGCVITGYAILYTFTTFMFWINAMAANIFFKFSSIMNSNSDNDNIKIVFYSIYAQGMPFLLCMIVFFMDSYGPCHMVM
jgi:hypothetical protein